MLAARKNCAWHGDRIPVMTMALARKLAMTDPVHWKTTYSNVLGNVESFAVNVDIVIKGFI